MFNRLIRWSLDHRWLVALGAALVLLFGSIVSMAMPVDVLPEFAPNQVVIQTEAPGLAPADVEALVTIPLESALNGATNVTDVRSESQIGLSVVTVVFKQGTDLYTDREIVNERLTAVAPHLPPGVGTPAMSPITSPVGKILEIGLTADKTSMQDLRTLADSTIRNRLLAVPGVSRVLVLGGDKAQYQVLVHPKAMDEYGVTLNQVARAVQDSNADAPGGFYRTPEREYLIRGLGRVHSVADLSRSVVTEVQGTPVTLDQVATVRFGSAPPIGMGSVNGKPAVILTISKMPGADTLRTTAAVERALAELKNGLPPDVHMTTILRQADFIRTSIRSVLGAMRDGALLVIVILFVFLFNWRTALISLLAIPLSLLIGVLSLKVLGISLNTMTLGGLTIAIGVVVDDAIVDVENVHRRLREQADTGMLERAKEIVYAASAEIRGSIVYATGILMLVMIPIFTLSGLEGRIFGPLGIALIAAIGASLFIALTVTPALCYILLPHINLRYRDSKTVEWLKNRYARLLDRAVFPHAKAIVGASAVLVLGTLAILPFLGHSFLPEFQEGNVVIGITGMPGMSLAMTNQIGLFAERSLMRIPGVKVAAQRAGRAKGDDDAGGSNFSEMDVDLSPAARGPALMAIRKALDVVPGVSVNIGSFISDRVNEVLSGSEAAIAVKLFGPDLSTLREKAGEIRAAMAKVKGVVDLQVEPQVPVEQLDIAFDRPAAARYGLSVGQIARDVQTLFNGTVVSQVVNQGQTFDLVLWSDEASRASPGTIARTLIDTPAGGRIPLSSVAKISFVSGPTTIYRENVSRRIVVQANVSGRDLGSAMADIQHQVAATVKLPRGYFVVYGGQFRNMQEATHQLQLFGTLALLGVFGLLWMAFRSWRSALLVILNLPLAMVGGVLAILFTGGVMSVASMIGFITLFGISTRNGILLVCHYNRLASEGKSLIDVLRRGSLDRLSPVLMTALAATLGMLPLAMLGGAGREIERPLATVVLGGMVTSTILTLLVIPALYQIVGRSAIQEATEHALTGEPSGTLSDVGAPL